MPALYSSTFKDQTHAFICIRFPLASDLLCLLTPTPSPLPHPPRPTHVPQVVCEEERQVIFTNLPELYNFHRTFCAQLQKMVRRDPAHVSQLFITHADDFCRLYSEYCARHSRSLLTLAERQKSKSFAAWISVCQEILKNQLSLKDDLLKPVQRILKYHLLLAEQV